MEYLYDPYKEKTIHASDIKELKSKLEAAMKQAFIDQNIPWDLQLQGKNFLYREVIKKLCEEILNQDEETAPFEILYLEDNELFHTELPIGKHAVKLNGLFDRVDRMTDSGNIRIVDYKTGKVDPKVKSYDVDAVFDQDEWAKNATTGRKEAFQGYLYAWLYDRKLPGREITMGYYTAKKLSQGMVYLNDGKPISQAQLAQFESQLRQLIEQIFSHDFPQATDERRCGYCAYKEICGR
jgi:hypothetical protein